MAAAADAFRAIRGSLVGRLKDGQLFVMIYRSDYWQCAFLIPKGGFDTIKAEGLPKFRQRLKNVAGFAADRVDETITDFDQVRLLTVMVDRLQQWARPGLLCIGDAAHAMSPIGGVGINLAIQDAVATANILGPVLQQGTPGLRDLKKVQARREFPTRVIQAFQVAAQRAVLAPILRATVTPKPPLFAETGQCLAMAAPVPSPVHRLGGPARTCEVRPAMNRRMVSNGLLEGSILKSLLSLAIPIVTANLLQSGYQLTDAFWVGRLGGAAVAAVSVSFPVMFLMSALGIGLAMAGLHAHRPVSRRRQ